MFGSITITLGIGPYSSYKYSARIFKSHFALMLEGNQCLMNAYQNRIQVKGIALLYCR